ncbi:integration host factor subunit beta [Methylotenera sp.]|uniref:integration host factor subunit beta n=1 Tax=Methylotenera sp. TaxID=2051956 RepID=UPI0024873EF0|nr:integration host factor subunit beta [Methylotenera sp.]MDI1361955.1 integration host factor subunit beta [Methylotenera sp.]
MTKSELITKLAEQFPQLTHADAQLSVQLILDSISESLAKKDRVEIRGFGSFNINTRPARLARNPKTGEKVQVDAKHVPHFKPGLDLRHRVK